MAKLTAKINEILFWWGFSKSCFRVLSHLRFLFQVKFVLLSFKKAFWKINLCKSLQVKQIYTFVCLNERFNQNKLIL